MSVKKGFLVIIVLNFKLNGVSNKNPIKEIFLFCEHTVSQPVKTADHEKGVSLQRNKFCFDFIGMTHGKQGKDKGKSMFSLSFLEY